MRQAIQGQGTQGADIRDKENHAGRNRNIIQQPTRRAHDREVEVENGGGGVETQVAVEAEPIVQLMDVVGPNEEQGAADINVGKGVECARSNDIAGRSNLEGPVEEQVQMAAHQVTTSNAFGVLDGLNENIGTVEKNGPSNSEVGEGARSLDKSPGEVDTVWQTQSEVQKEISLVRERMNNPSLIPTLRGPGKVMGFKVIGSAKKNQVVRKAQG